MDVRFLEGIEANLPTTITDGNIYYCTDTAKLYIDMNGERKCVSSSSSDENKYLWRQWNKEERGSTTTTLSNLDTYVWDDPHYYTGTFDENNYNYANGTETRVNLTYNDGVILDRNRLTVGNTISINSDSTISLPKASSSDTSIYADSTKEANFEPYYVVDTGKTISAGKYFYFSNANSVPEVYSVTENIQLQMIATLEYDDAPTHDPAIHGDYTHYNYRWCILKNTTTGLIPDVYRTTATYSQNYVSNTSTLFESDNPSFMTNNETDTLLTESLGKRGELEKKAAYIELGSYVGTGTNRITLTFSSCPKIVMITNGTMCAMLFRDGGDLSTDDAFKNISRSFNGNKLTWSVTSFGSGTKVAPCNVNGAKYNVLAIY